MDVQRAKYFLAFANAGSVSAAAAELNISQPALSRQLARLEAESGLQLIDRGGPSLRLTRAGHTMVDICTRLLAEQHRAEQSLERLRGGELASLTVAATQTTNSTVVAPFVAASGTDLPPLSVQPVEHYRALEALERGADMVISPIPPRGNVAHLTLGEAPIRAFVRAESRNAAGPIDVAELVQHRLVLASGASVSRGLLDTFIAAAGQRLGPYLECDDVSVVLALAKAGQGLGVCTALRADGMQAREIHHAGRALGGVPLSLVWNPGHVAHAAIEDLGLRLREFMAAAVSSRT